MDGGIFVDISGHFTHGKAHVSIEFVPYLYRKATTFYTDIRCAFFANLFGSEHGENECCV
jgi:hypothetical protein